MKEARKNVLEAFEIKEKEDAVMMIADAYLRRGRHAHITNDMVETVRGTSMTSWERDAADRWNEIMQDVGKRIRILL